MMSITRPFIYISAATAMLAFSLLLSPRAHAGIPPDSCFVFDSATGAISNYYDNENNNPTNPACTRQVDIPAAIGGAAVTAVADTAFQGKQITTLVLPNGLTSIGQQAFAHNQIATLNIPNTVTDMRGGAFIHNQLIGVNISTGLTSIAGTVFANNKLTAVTIPNNIT